MDLVHSSRNSGTARDTLQPVLRELTRRTQADRLFLDIHPQGPSTHKLFGPTSARGPLLTGQAGKSKCISRRYCNRCVWFCTRPVPVAGRTIWLKRRLQDLLGTSSSTHRLSNERMLQEFRGAGSLNIENGDSPLVFRSVMNGWIVTQNTSRSAATRCDDNHAERHALAALQEHLTSASEL